MQNTIASIRDRFRAAWRSSRQFRSVVIAGSVLSVCLFSWLFYLVSAPPAEMPATVPEIAAAIEPTNTPQATRTTRPTRAPTSAPTSVSGETSTPQPKYTVLPDGQSMATVAAIVDGDTIDVLIGGQTFRVRYIGINTPERDQVCSGEATQANAALVSGQEVLLVKDVSETDQYGRLLRYVYVNKVMINAQLVADGWAEPATYPPDVRFADHFANLAAEAREAGRGCWGTSAWAPVPVAPVVKVTQPPVVVQPTAPPAPATVCSCSGNFFDCGNFSSHAAAQACFEYCWSVVGYDVHWLDGDNDGVACESLP